MNKMENHALKFTIVCVLTIIMCHTSSSQQLDVEWHQQFGNNDWDCINDMLEIENGDLWLVGNIRCPSITDTTSKRMITNGWISVTDNQGINKWQNYITGNGYKSISSISTINDNVFLTGIFQDTIYYDTNSLISDSHMSGFGLILNQNGKASSFFKIGTNANIHEIYNCAFSTGKMIIGIEFSDSLYLNNKYVIPFNHNSIILSEVSNQGFLSNTFEITGTTELNLIDIKIQDSAILVAASFSDSIFIGDTAFFAKDDLDSFIAKFNANGLDWYNQISGKGDQIINQICSENNLIGITGYIESNSFFDSLVIQSYGSKDCFIALLDSNGKYEWINSIGNISEDQGHSIYIKNGTIYVAGSYNNVINIPYINGNFMQYKALSPFGNSFIAKYGANGLISASYNLSSNSENYCKKIIVDTTNNITAVGNFHAKIELNEGGNKIYLNSAGSKDIFLFRINDKCENYYVDAGKDTTICPGQQISLIANPEYQFYFWEPSGLANTNLLVSESGTYFLTVMNESGCISKDSLKVINAEILSVFAGNDTIIEAGASLILEKGQGIAKEWFWNTNGTGYFSNTNTITTEYFFTYQDLSLSEITLTLNGSNECGSKTDSLIVSIPFDEDGITIYPNPTSGNTTIISINNQIIQSLIITNQNGYILHNNENINSTAYFFDLNTYPPGTYLYHITTNVGTFTKPINKI